MKANTQSQGILNTISAMFDKIIPKSDQPVLYYPPIDGSLNYEDDTFSPPENADKPEA